MYKEALVLGLYSITPVHAGSGAELSVIDLPIQRERHTGFPTIWGQSLKGVLRNAFEKEDKDKGVIYSIFGPDTERASEHAGAISVGDARILLFPVRSARGVFAYVTCPMVLERFKRDMEFAGRSDIASFNIPEVVKDGKALVHKDSILTINRNNKALVVLEDLLLTAEENDFSQIIDAIKKIVPDGVDDLGKRLVIVSNNVFSAFVKFSTEIVARIAIDQSRGTVKEGGLWYEEFLPADTLLYSIIAISEPKGGSLKDAGMVKRELQSFLDSKKYLQVGGDETVGKGFVKVKVL
ncbi:type III-B CRISPR module RAMP protein Cmr4 [Thermococcus chitonophagus]|uniref:CRISPR-associated RAMP Cmr4 n=1 Tax=Thermococcus chitonophagus TaxID=54262 RepID=A0A161KAA4_9EURY|nr:type III-B CRISPR module RAMP protein Cmr4 [Thermococcus chitonophagus]ASJ16079.1 type III-B CRISPR module RAMP protein Cmr4 [Thermococcus chitonophagus]CUX77328.1 CRISPR-associated RAMP Cmr4 [Thermococcus chitonophagus]